MQIKLIYLTLKDIDPDKGKNKFSNRFEQVEKVIENVESFKVTMFFDEETQMFQNFVSLFVTKEDGGNGITTYCKSYSRVFSFETGM